VIRAPLKQVVCCRVIEDTRVGHRWGRAAGRGTKPRQAQTS
jgi:hypothetical protein